MQFNKVGKLRKNIGNDENVDLILVLYAKTNLYNIEITNLDFTPGEKELVWIWSG